MNEFFNKQFNYMWLKAVLDFLSSITASLAWPLGAALIVYLIRVHFFKWIGNAKKLSFGGAEIHLEQAVDKVIINAMDYGITVGRPRWNDPSGNSESSKFDLFSFIVKWQKIEKMFTAYYSATNTSDPISARTAPIRTLFKRAFNEGKIDKNLYAMLNELNSLRNAIVHDIPSADLQREDLIGLLQSVTERVSQSLTK